MSTPRIALTAGEPAGIGPDLMVRLAQRDWPAELVVCGNPEVIQQRAKRLSLPLQLHPYDPTVPARSQTAGSLTILPLSCPAPVSPGQLDAANASYVLATLERAGQGALEREFAAIMTAPVHKGIMNDAGIPFSGHTEFFADQAKVPQVVMMLASAELRVALVTTHLPLREVATAITQERIGTILTILQHDLVTKFGIQQPHILVCGLNPHAGEQGHLGDEEITTIEPALAAARQRGIKVTGPLPADTLFQPKYLATADAVLAMYHDQGLPVLKYQGFGQAMNITLGLPYIRTSVDHGTALDLAGSDQVDTGSAQFALTQAISLAQSAALSAKK